MWLDFAALRGQTRCVRWKTDLILVGKTFCNAESRQSACFSNAMICLMDAPRLTEAKRGSVLRHLGLHGAVIPQADLVTGLKAAAQAGFGAYEPEVPRVHELNPGARREADQLRRELGLRWLPLNEIQAFGPGVEENAPRVLDMAAELSIPAVTLIPALRPDGIGFQQAVDGLERLKELAAARGISLMWEMLAFPQRPFPSPKDALDLATAAKIKLVVDTFHYIVGGAEVGQYPSQVIGTVHITDAVLEGKSLAELADTDRVLPGEGGLRLADFMQALRKTGYREDMSVEVFHPKYGRSDPFEVASTAYQRTTDLLRASGWVD